MFRSKLPDVGTTVFTVMTELAMKSGAINLAQGFPDYPCNPNLVDYATQAMREGHNQYAPMPGLPALRTAVASNYARSGININPDSQLTITPGATAGLYTAFAAFVHPGDEVLILTPAYDSYAPAVRSLSGSVVAVPLLNLSFLPDWDAIRAAITPKTRVIVVNTPHNPTATVWGTDDLAELATLAEEYNLMVVSDEVYDRMTFDDVSHCSPFSHPALRERTVVVTSFGKTLHVTGWKVGCLMASESLTAELRKVHQFLAFCVHTPAQHAIALALAEPDVNSTLREFFTHKRNLFRNALRGSSLTLMPCHGTYFQLVTYAGNIDDVTMAKQCTTEHGVAAIPVSPFMLDTTQGSESRYLRFCFAKHDETLLRAAERLVAAFPV
jgi:methionine aminotransferase